MPYLKNETVTAEDACPLAPPAVTSNVKVILEMPGNVSRETSGTDHLPSASALTSPCRIVPLVGTRTTLPREHRTVAPGVARPREHHGAADFREVATALSHPPTPNT